MSDKKAKIEETQRADSLIPIDTIEASSEDSDGPFVPRALPDDPDAGDASAAREGVEVSSWRLHTLDQDKLMSMAEPSGTDRKSRKTRRVHRASRRARTDKVRAKRNRMSLVAGLFVALLVAGGAYAAISYVYEQWGGKTVPSVVGLSQANAVAQVEEKGLTVTIEAIPADALDGRVVEVRPAAGERVEDGSEVHLFIGTSRTVPEIVGMSREEARAALEAMGAENIRFESRVTVEEEDKVLEVNPPAGSVFISSEEIKVIVSQLPRMLDVVGEEEGAALLHLDREGIAAQTQYERGTAEQRLHVIRTAPEAGQTVGGEGAVVYVGDPLINALRIEDYFDATGSHILEFLQAEGYTPSLGYHTEDGGVKARFENPQGFKISFLAEPWKHDVDVDGSGYSEVIDDSMHVEGVRLYVSLADEQASTALATSGLNDPTVGEATANDVMALCGFNGMLGSCTQSTITLPKGTGANGTMFYCCYGESAQNVWTILIRGTSSSGKLMATEVIATCAPQETYAAIDLRDHGGSICDYVAYQELYQ